MKKTFLIAAVALLHFILTQLGNLFTIPFGYASLIWPLAGITLGLYFLFGWPVIMAAAISYSASFTIASPSYASNQIDLINIAAVGILQLLIAKALIERFSSLPVKSQNASEIVRFLLLSGPLASAVTASLLTLILALNHSLDIRVLGYVWAARWVGDLASIVFLTPIILFLYPNKYVKRARKPWASITSTLIVIITVYIIYGLLNANHLEQHKREFVSETEPFQHQFNLAQTTINNNLNALNGLIQANQNTSAEEFSRFASQVHQTNTVSDIQLNIRALGWIPLISESERSNFEAKLRNRGLAQVGIKQLGPNGIQPAVKSSSYLPIRYLEPFEANRAAIGLDVSSHPIVKQTVQHAIENNKVSVSPILSLAQQQDKYNGVVAYSPVFNASDNRLLGLVEVVIELDELIISLYKNTNTEFYALSFRYDNNAPIVSSHNPSAAFSHTVELSFFDKQAVIEFSSKPKTEIQLADWSTILVMIVCSIIGVICVMFVFFIVTFNASLTKKVNESTEILTKKNEELHKANHAKNLFLANISHEYRTPLNAIIGFTEVARRESVDNSTHSYLQQIEESSNVLLGIVNDVLDTSKMQAGELTLESNPFNPAKETQNVIDMLTEKAESKSIQINTNFIGLEKTWLRGDVIRYKQILINLLNNAVKFTEEGNISISLSLEPLEDDNVKLHITVADTGIGISSNQIEKLFEPFAQAESSTSRKYGGTGLGLSIVRQLCVLMSGDIKVNSELKRGSEFVATIVLPKTEQPNESATDNSNSISDFVNKTVLVVEDNKINQLVVQKQLQMLNIECKLADDGEQALACLEVDKPDFILMDLQMPVMDGFTVTKLIKANPRFNDIPIAILSASVGASEKQKANDLGVVDFIDKPFKQQDLIKVFDKYLSD